MRRLLALLAMAAIAIGAAAIDPCKRQPFRGRCPSENGAAPRRSQFVLRYYARNGECVSYPYGHCAADESEPQLHRYKEECEDACITSPPANLGSPKDNKDSFDQTYGTVGPLSKETPTAAVIETTKQPAEVTPLATTESATSTEKPTTAEATTTSAKSTTVEQSTTTEAATTTEEPTTTAEVTTETPTTVEVATEATTTNVATTESTSTTTEAAPSTTQEANSSTTEEATSPSTTTEATSTTSTTTHAAPVVEKEVTLSVDVQASAAKTDAPASESTTAPARTECERRRAASSSSKIRGGFVPVCKADGSFEKLQCEPDARQCFCVDASGIEVANSRTRNGSKPDCDKIASAPRSPAKDCVGSIERGPCSASISRWNYDEKEQKCKLFTFSGCGGNGNNFENEKDCLQRCAPPTGLPKCHKGEPLKTKAGAPVNCAKTECPSGYKCSVVQQSSVCCPESDKIIGMQTSHSNEVCSLDKERGPCDKYELRFYYNADLKECKYFFWGGCDGNGNNFESIETCETTCGIAKNRDPSATSSPRNQTPRTMPGIRINTDGGERNDSTTTVEATTSSATTAAARASVTTTTQTRALPTRRVQTQAPRELSTTSTTGVPRTRANRRKDDEGDVEPIHARPAVPPVPHTFMTEGTTESTDSENRCIHPKDNGNCRGQFVRWFWDSEKKMCDVFTYSGCQGNGNNFASREECLAICHREVVPVVAPDFANVCKHDVDAGECNGVFQRFAFDFEAGECRPFTYGGCGGNGNNFATIAECRSKCHKATTAPVNACENDIEAGECTGVFSRFGYDKESNDCRPFTYGGCGGNGNNFASIAECRSVCIKKSCKPVAQCDLARCQLVTDNHGCPFCSCGPMKQPSPPGSNGSPCPPVDVARCQEPCMVFNNRRGCQECVCPKLPSAVPPVVIAGSAPSAPATPVRVGPPAGPTKAAPPAPRAPNVVNGIHTLEIQDKPTELNPRNLLPPTVSNELEKCMQPVEPGPCKHFVDRWFFSAEDDSCHPFKYGGCAGNRNHFYSQKECEIHCARFLRSPSSNEHVHANPTPDNWVYHETVSHAPTTTQAPLERQRFIQRPLTQPKEELVVQTREQPVFIPREITRPREQTVLRTIERERLPFDLPASVRAHAVANYEPANGEKNEWGTTPYPETYITPEVTRRIVATTQRATILTQRDRITQTHKDLVEKSNELLTPVVLKKPTSTHREVVEIVKPIEHPVQHRNEQETTLSPRQPVTRTQPVQHPAQPTFVPHAHTENIPTPRAPQQHVDVVVPHRDLEVHHVQPLLPQNLAPRAPPQLLPQVPIQHQPPFHPREAVPTRLESVRVEPVPKAIPLQPKKSTQTYDMPTIDTYNPQRNPNLEGLSPPVDPTYFTYNSQNLGQRRQFAVNSIPFDKQAPLFVPRNFGPNQNFNQQQPRPQFHTQQQHQQFTHQQQHSQIHEQNQQFAPQQNPVPQLSQQTPQQPTPQQQQQQQFRSFQQQQFNIQQQQIQLQRQQQIAAQQRQFQQQQIQQAELRQRQLEHNREQTVSFQHQRFQQRTNTAHSTSSEDAPTETHVRVQTTTQAQDLVPLRKVHQQQYEQQRPQPVHNLNIRPIQTTTRQSVTTARNEPVTPKRIRFNGEYNPIDRTMPTAKIELKKELRTALPVEHGVRNFVADQKKWTYFEGDYYGPTIPGIRIDQQSGQPMESVDATVGVSGRHPPTEALETFQRHSKNFMTAAREAIHSFRNSTPVEKTSFARENNFTRNAPKVLPPDHKPRKMHELEEVDLPVFLQSPPPNNTVSRPTVTLNAHRTLPNLPFDNFSPHMQQVNRTITELFDNRSSNNLTTPTNKTLPALNIRRIVPGAEDSSEEPDELPPVHGRAFGVVGQHPSVPIPVEKYQPPTPLLRAEAPSSRSGYGKKDRVALPISNSIEMFSPMVEESPATTRGIKITPTSTQAPTTATIATTGATISSSTMSDVPLSSILSTTGNTEITNADADATTTTRRPPTTATGIKHVPVAATTVVNEIDSMDSEEDVEALSQEEMLASSKFNDAVQKQVDEETKFETVELALPKKVDAEKAPTLKKIEITISTTTTVATTTEAEIDEAETTDIETTEDETTEADTSASQTTKAPENELSTGIAQTTSVESTTEAVAESDLSDESEFEDVSGSESEDTTTSITTKATSAAVAPSTAAQTPEQSTTDSTTTTTALSGSSTTTEAELSTTKAQTPEQSTTDSTTTTTATSGSSTTTEAAPSTTKAAPAITLVDETDDEEDDSEENTAVPPAKPEIHGVPAFEPMDAEDVIEPALVGRQPIPDGPTGIARNPVTLDIDGLEEPTTVVPTTRTVVKSSPTAPQATNRFTAPATNAAAAPAPLNNHVHAVRPEIFDARIACALPAEAGQCTNYVQRWFFNSQSSQCEQFSFGSCGGNQNNFADRTTCELKCMTAHASVLSQVPERCSYDKDGGFGKGYNVKWYFNMRNLRCEQFVYEGQGGNSNQFETLSDCERFCTPQPASPTVRHVIATAAQIAVPTAAPTVAITSARTSAPTAAHVASSSTASPTAAPTVDQTSIETAAPTTPFTVAPTAIARPIQPVVTPKSHILRPLPEQPTEVFGEYDSNDVDNDTRNLPTLFPPEIAPIALIERLAPQPPLPLPEPPMAPGTEPHPPAAQGTKIITKEQVDAKVVEEKKQPVYKAEPIPEVPVPNGNEHLPVVGPSPPMEVNYQTGQVKPIAHGIKPFVEGKLDINGAAIEDTDDSESKGNFPSCPNGLQEMRYANGRPVMCLPGKNQCPDRSVCYFNGMDFFCCPNTEDPYDKHVFGGYDGEETRNGYKVFGPLRIRRLMDDVPLRTKRQTSMDSAFNTLPVSFNLDSVIAPLRFDAEKPRTVSRAERMRKPRPPQHGNPMCILPLVKGDCSEAHLRYYYDRQTDSCRLFYYSGCQGNANNFGSLEDCQKLCVLRGQPLSAVPQATAAHVDKSVAPGQCPTGAPLGGSAPVLCGNSTDSIGCPSGFYCRAGPPDVCCPGTGDKIAAHQPSSEIRLSPETTTEVSTKPRGYHREALLATPKYMCPDASDPLMSSPGEPVLCGAGFDGMKMCPRGYYCAIDVEKESRLCCPLYGSASRIPAEHGIAPSFGSRTANPGEVIERGSLPADQDAFMKKTATSTESGKIAATTVNGEDSDEDRDDDEEKDDPIQHLQMKPDGRHSRLQLEDASQSPKATDVDAELVNIDVPTEAPIPVEEVPEKTKQAADKSFCQMKPTEGRTCREDEKAPRTNLHYFYSAKDNRCKLYFYRGCGGNENRFEKKADCEALCLRV